MNSPESLASLLSRHHTDFIQSAFLAALGREPNEREQQSYLKELLSGDRSKIEIIGRLRFSKEGRKFGAHFPKLRTKYFVKLLFRIPILGYLFASLSLMFRLPLLAKNLQGVEQFSAGLNKKESGQVDVKGLVARVEELEEQNVLDQTNRRFEVQDEQLESLASWLGGLDHRLQDVSTQLGVLNSLEHWLKGLEHRLELMESRMYEQQRVIGLILGKLQFSEAAATIGFGSQDETEKFYLGLMEKFRGSHEVVKQRLKFYLPFFQDLQGKVIDLGCGRGEWLELLNEANVESHGIDENSVLVGAGLERGLSIETKGLHSFLSHSEDSSIAGVTAFHVFEHLAFEALLSALLEIYRVLIPGGVIAVELPNPENLIVGAFSFHFDPTHVKPIPPELLQFYVEYCGFVDVHIERLNPIKEYAVAEDESESSKALLSNHIAIGADYALICKKPDPRKQLVGKDNK